MKRRHNHWALSTALTLFLLLGICCLAASGPNAKTLYARGQAAESKDDPITAYEDYYQAYEKEPKNLRYKTAYERLRFQAGSAHVKKGEALAAQGIAPEARHGGGEPGFVQENQAFGRTFRDGRGPRLPCRGDVRAILFGCPDRFF